VSLKYGEWPGFARYFLLCIVAAALPTAAVFVFWSLWGWGEESYRVLDEASQWVYVFSAIAAVCFLGLYLADFFWPPFFPGKYWVLWANDKLCGRSIFSIGVAALFCASLFAADSYPTVPVLVTVLCGPMLVMAIRALTLQKNPQRHMTRKEARDLKMPGRVSFLRSVAFTEKDAKLFYSAAAAAFLLCGVASLVLWLIWCFVIFEESVRDFPVESVKWVCAASPFFSALANLMFFIFLCLRVWMARVAEQTDELANDIALDIVQEGVKEDLKEELNHQNILAEFLQEHGLLEQFQNLPKDAQRSFVNGHINHMQILSNVVKVVGCSLLFMIGGVYVAAELVTTTSQIARLALGFLAIFFITFISLVLLWFRRLKDVMRDKLVKLPLWRMAVSLSQNDWCRAGFLAFVLPWVPIFLLLSAANQLVRRLRRRYGILPVTPPETPPATPPETPPGTPKAATLAPEAQASDDPPHGEEVGYLTERVMLQLRHIQNTWDWLSLVEKMYVCGLALTVYVLSPRLLNVLLAWLISLLTGMHFGIILVCTFWAGLFCFLLPPVPGVPVYLFGGFVISAACHQTPTKDYAPGAPQGFAYGVIISIVLGFFLKLAACAMQQKLIGEQLGSSTWVRQQVCVHKPFIRAIEAVLRKKGYTMGKIAILCGGPDWPTSVMAGIMRLSLLEMEVGTIPIIFFIGPCCLSGAFYVRSGDGKFWENLASLMIASTLIVNLVLWIGAAWAIQEQLENNHWDVSKPLLKNVDLDWLDYRADQIRNACVINLDSVPKVVMLIFVSGMLAVVLVGQVFYWLPTLCFNEFAVNDSIADLKIVAEDGLILYTGVAGLAIVVLGTLGLVQFSRWRTKQCRPAQMDKARELEDVKDSWKESRRIDAQAKSQRQASLADMSESMDAAVPRQRDGPEPQPQESAEERLRELVDVEAGADEPQEPTTKAAPTDADDGRPTKNKIPKH